MPPVHREGYREPFERGYAMRLTLQKASKIEQQNAALRAELRAAKRKIKELRQAVERSAGIRLDKTEIDLLSRIAECDIDQAFAVDFAADLDLTPARLDYHLQRLVDGSYIDVLFTDSALGDSFGITQKGRHALVKRHRL
jgi:DNA-binding MarR family transcriptional regulator